MAIPVTLTALSLPEGVCETITSEQARLNAYVQYTTGEIQANLTGIVASTTSPGDTSVVWLKLDAYGNPVRLYKYFGGWKSLHTLQPGFTMLWTDSLPDMDTFDGGSSGAVGAATGPMWEVVTGMSGKFPVGVGAFSGGTTVSETGTGGADEITLTTGQLPPHTHTVTAKSSLDINETSDRTLFGAGTEFVGSADTGETGDGDPVPILPPYYGVYFLRRTDRLYYAET